MITIRSVFDITFKTLVLILLSVSCYSQSAEIVLDGNFEDWNEGLSSFYDGTENLAGTDLLSIQISNNEKWLFIKVEGNLDFDLTEPLIDTQLNLFLDTDGNENSGLNITEGFGAEIGIHFQDRNAHLYLEGQDHELSFSDFSLRVAPTVTSNTFEIAISRDIIFEGLGPLFGNNSIKVQFINYQNGDWLPNEGAFYEYHFDETPVNDYSAIAIEKENEEHIRIVVYNTLGNGLNNQNRRPHFENIIKVLSPDVIGFSESGNTSIETVLELMNSWLPLENSNGWYVAKKEGDDLITASKWPITHQSNALNNQFPVKIDLPNSYPRDLLFTNSHLRCCGNNGSRQDDVDEYISFLLEAKAGEVEFDLEEGTPFVYGGDLNLVGYKQQLETLINGTIVQVETYGEGGPPDWDNTPVSDSKALLTDLAMDYTWRRDAESFPPGKLDFLIHSDAVLKVEKSFVLETEIMSQERLDNYGLLANNTASASDHFPVIADYSIRSSSNVYESELDQIKFYPNPSKNLLNFNTPIPEGYTVKVFELNGKSIDNIYLDSARSSLNVSHMLRGLFILQITDRNGFVRSEKFIKM